MKTVVSFLLLTLGVTLLVANSNQGRFGTPGTNDFVEYWAAYHVAINGGNPYDAETLFEMQQSVGREDSLALMMWNPPLTLTILSPILQARFESSASIFLILNIILLFALCELTRSLLKTLTKQRVSPLQLLPALLSYPLFLSITLGQVGLILSLGVLLFTIGLIQKRTIFVVFGSALIAIKPHLFLLLGVYVIYRALFLKEKAALIIAASTVLTLALITELIFPGITFNWLHAIGSSDLGPRAIPVSHWQGSNPLSLIRFLISDDPSMISLHLYTATIVIVFVAFLTRFKEKSTNAVGVMDAVIISSCLSPFGWLFDYSALFSHAALISVSPPSGKRTPSIGFWVVLSINMLAFAFGAIPRSYLDYWWYAPSMTIAWFMFRKPLET